MDYVIKAGCYRGKLQEPHAYVGVYKLVDGKSVWVGLLHFDSHNISTNLKKIVPEDFTSVTIHNSGILTKSHALVFAESNPNQTPNN